MSEDQQTTAPDVAAAEPPKQAEAAAATPAAVAEPAPVVVAPANGVDPDRYAEARAMATQHAKQAEELRAQLEEHRGQMARALELAKRNAKLAAMPSLANESYLALAPDVDLTDTGALTDESRQALKQWQKEHKELFRVAAGGLTPGVEGGEKPRSLTDDQLMTLAGVGVKDINRWRKNVPQAVINKIEAQRLKKRV